MKHSFLEKNISSIKTPLVRRHFLYYLGYSLLVWFIHLIVISLITFIHLQLGHGVKIIDEWVFQNAWMIVTFSKFIALVFSFAFIRIWSDQRNLLSDLLKINRFSFSYKLVLSIFSFWVILLIWGAPQFKSEAELFKNIISLIGIFCFYLFDFFFIVALNKIFPISLFSKKIEVIFFPFIFGIVSTIVFPYRLKIGFDIVFILMFLLYLYFNFNEDWSNALLFLVAAIAPLFSFLGLDPFWFGSFSYWKMSHFITTFEWAGIFFVLWAYLRFHLHPIKIFHYFKRTIKEFARGDS